MTNPNHEVERFTFTGSRHKSPTGEWVRYSDYEKLGDHFDSLVKTLAEAESEDLKQREAARKANAQALAEVREAVQSALDIARGQAERINQVLDDYPAYSSAEDAIQEAEAALHGNEVEKIQAGQDQIKAQTLAEVRELEPQEYAEKDFGKGTSLLAAYRAGYFDAKQEALSTLEDTQGEEM